MSGTKDFSDLPIGTPENDLFGIDPFVKSLAKSITSMKRPEGVVIALDGIWGSGKSSAINLLKHHLTPSIDKNELQIVTFNPWWFRGEEALILAFFRELHAATNPSLSEKAKRALPKLGARLLKLGSATAPVFDGAAVPNAGTAAAGALSWLAGLIEDGESIEKLHDQLAEALGQQNKRFVVIIDDIDRLAPDEAVAMFRLIKSVGRLPNITYVLAFDRRLAEKIVSQHFPSEGPHYLEKIVQISFDLPMPTHSDLVNYLGSNITQIVGEFPDDRQVHVLNLFHEIVMPEIRSPRDAVRFLNALTVTWPAVQGEVDLGDFLALETYRLFQPALHQAIRNHPELLCGVAKRESYGKKPESGDLDVTLLHSVEDKQRYRRGLMRLFPKLEAVWSNFHHGGTGWRKFRRACLEDFFPIYFRLSLPDNVVAKSEIDLLIQKIDEPSFVAGYLRSAVLAQHTRGGTKAALLLDALTAHASDITVERTRLLLGEIFAVADDLHVAIDEARGFSMGNNVYRIHWLMRALLLERTSLAERTVIITDAAQHASLYWLVDLAISAWDDYHPREGQEKENEERALTTEDAAELLVDNARKAIEEAAHDHSLLQHRELAYLLYRWRDIAKDEGLAVKRWTAEILKDDSAVARFSESFITYTWSQSGGFGGLGDLVSTRSDTLHINGLDSVLDKAEFRRRLEELNSALPVDSADRNKVHRCLEAWNKAEKEAARRRSR
jgi:predicted KAP-like P-loop ATPase